MCVSLLIATLVIILLTYIFLVSYKKNCVNRVKGSALFVIAHPDDECMFFAPTILNLSKEGYRICLICLSSGGYCNKNVERKKELRESCKILGIPSENVIIIEHSKLPDNPEVVWNETKVAIIIRKYVIQLSANIVFSFDEYGVSGHLNHIAIHKGLKYLKRKELLPKDSHVFQLKSVFLFQKYLAFICVPLCLFFSDVYFISTFKDVLKIWLSMKAHKSQLVWFRKLYIIFSMYIYCNTYKELLVNEKLQ